MAVEIFLFIFTTILLYQEAAFLKPNFCEFTEEVFEYVPKTVIVQQKKERKEKNGVLRLLNPRNLFAKNEYENVTKTEMVAEKRKRVYVTCCYGFIKIRDECVSTITSSTSSMPSSSTTVKSTSTVAQHASETSSVTLEVSSDFSPSTNAVDKTLAMTPTTAPPVPPVPPVPPTMYVATVPSKVENSPMQPSSESVTSSSLFTESIPSQNSPKLPEIAPSMSITTKTSALSNIPVPLEPVSTVPPATDSPLLPSNSEPFDPVPSIPIITEAPDQADIPSESFTKIPTVTETPNPSENLAPSEGSTPNLLTTTFFYAVNELTLPEPVSTNLEMDGKESANTDKITEIQTVNTFNQGTVSSTTAISVDKTISQALETSEGIQLVSMAPVSKETDLSTAHEVATDATETSNDDATENEMETTFPGSESTSEILETTATSDVPTNRPRKKKKKKKKKRPRLMGKS